jgi:hypothetical protein
MRPNGATPPAPPTHTAQANQQRYRIMVNKDQVKGSAKEVAGKVQKAYGDAKARNESEQRRAR